MQQIVMETTRCVTYAILRRHRLKHVPHPLVPDAVDHPHVATTPCFLTDSSCVLPECRSVLMTSSGVGQIALNGRLNSANGLNRGLPSH